MLRAVFIDGDFKGEYDWKGGIPLSKGETLSVKINKKLLKYRLIRKEITCDAEKEDQKVDVLYTFQLI